MSARTFGPQFRLQDFKGPLARHYADPEDLFQQLVGAVLLELFPQRVSVTSTKGRDGAVDIFVEAGAEAAELFFGLRFPIIAECKYHDDSLGTLTRNVDLGWSRVRDKLARQARAGWEGTYQPWRRAKGYLYCVSAVLHQQARDKLTQSIREFFDSLPPEQRPSVENIHVLTWSDVAPLLNSHTRLADAWLGTELEGIVGHEAYKEGLSGFRLYLKEDKLSFIFPVGSDPAHPENLLSTLEKETSNAGVLLVGPSGVGKTRTCFEVARLADGKGWRVLHLLPGEPPVTAASVQEIVLQGTTPTLLVIDYLERMTSLDLSTIRYRLFPETKARGIRLAILSNTRPGVLHRADPERDAIFRRIEIDIKDRRSQIAAHLQETIAPKASAILGSGRVREICGTRPIIGMFIARELERSAQEGKLNENVVCRLRQGDLQGWIRRRFEEDGLLPQGTHPLLPAAPDHVMIGCAAGLAAAPLPRAGITRVVSETLAATGAAEAKETADSLVASLVRSGWLEEDDYELSAAHDVIADELLELTLCDPDQGTVRGGIVDKVLIGALAMPRVLGRFSVSLDRVLGQEDSQEGMLQALKESVSTWFIGHASEMGRVFTAAAPSEVSYALGAVVTGTAWGNAVTKVWDELISPWLALYGRDTEARHLLYCGLKEIPDGSARTLVDTSYRWLNDHGAQLEAQFVLRVLLGRSDLGDQAKPATGAAMNWLKDHGAQLQAQFVLGPLLGRSDLGDQAKPATDGALAWLEEHGAQLEAFFVLDPLVARSDLGDQTKSAIDVAMNWLEDHLLTEGAEFVLNKLLGRSHLSEDQRERCVTLALRRLDKVIETTEASFLLRSCLNERIPLREQRKLAVECALRWLRFNAHADQIDFVFKRLLRDADLEDRIWREVADHALAWLKRTSLAPDRDHALNSLLMRPMLLTP